MNSTSMTFFENLMNPNKEIREQAERDLEKLKQIPFAESIKIFSEGLTSPKENIFQMTTLMLKKTYLDDKQIRAQLSPDQLASLKALLKSHINLSFSWKSLQRVADCLGVVYQLSNLGAGFGEITIMFTNQEATSRQLALYLIENICEQGALNEDVIKSSLKDFIDIFTQGLNDSTVLVKVRAVCAIFALLNHLETESVVMEFKSLRDPILETLVVAMKEQEQSILSTMQFFITKFPKFWKDKVELIIDIVCQIAKGKSFPNVTRESALELVYSFAKDLSGLIKKSPNFNKMFIPLMFELSLELDNIDKLEKWEKDTEEKDVDRDEMYYGITGGFDRLTRDLGGKYFMEATAGFVKKYLQSTNWVEVHAGYMIMANLAEGCKENYKSHLQETLNFISVGLTHAHPRVRYAALTAFGLILKETSPVAQQKYTNNILPALAQLMGEKEACIRVKTQSCNALVEFLRGLLENSKEDEDDCVEIIKPYLEDLVKLISNLFEESLKTSYAPLQEATLSTFSLLSNLLNKNFAPYYNFIMPGMKKLFYSIDAKTPEQKKLKSDCIETIAFLCSSISECSNDYMNDLTELSEAFIKYFVTIQEEDPQYLTLLNSFTHFSLSMKEKFVPVLNILIPLIVPLIKADIGIKFEDAPIADLMPQEESNEIASSVVVQIGADYKKFSLNTFALQNKILAFNVFNDIANNMGKTFFPYTEQLLKTALELIKFAYSQKIRKISIKAIVSCINSCSTDQERAKILLFIQDIFFAGFTNAIKIRRIGEIKTYLKSITGSASLITDKTAFTEQFIMKLYQCLHDAAELLILLKKDILKKAVENKNDEDNEDILMEDFDNLNEILRRVMEVSGIIFKLFREPLTALVTQHLYQIFLDDWQSSLDRKVFKSDQEIINAICFFDDYMEYSAIEAFNLFNETYLTLTYGSPTKNEDIVQSVVYGYGIICQRVSKENFNKIKDKLATGIIQTIQRPVNEENQNTFDNAIGAMGKLIYYQCTNDANGIALSAQFIKLLPLKFDFEEGKAVCKAFFQKVIEAHPLIVTEANIPLIKEAITRINDLNKEELFLEEEEVQLKVVASKLGVAL